MICTNCGARIGDCAKFCGRCGEPVELADGGSAVVVQGDAPRSSSLLPGRASDAASAAIGTTGSVSSSQPSVTTGTATASCADMEPSVASIPAGAFQSSNAANSVECSIVGGFAADGASNLDRPRKSMAVLAVLLTLVLVATAALVIAWWQVSEQNQQASREKIAEAGRTCSVVIQFGELPGYDSAATKIPVLVEGTQTVDGNRYSQEFFLGPDGTGICVLPGSYSVRVVASPILGDGRLYAAIDENATVGFQVDGTAIEEGSIVVPTQDVWHFDYADWMTVDDDRIDRICKAAERAGCDATYLEGLRQKMIVQRDEAVEADRQAKEKAARQVAPAGAGYTLFIPESWRDEVVKAVDGRNVSVCQQGYAARCLVWVRVVDASSVQEADSKEKTCIKTLRSGSDRYELWAYNWAYLAWASVNDCDIPDRPTDTQMRTGLELLTGGTASYEDCARRSASSEDRPAIVKDPFDYVRNEVAPGFQLTDE